MTHTEPTKTITVTVKVTLIDGTTDESKIREVVQSIVDGVPHDNTHEVELVEFDTDSE